MHHASPSLIAILSLSKVATGNEVAKLTNDFIEARSLAAPPARALNRPTKDRTPPACMSVGLDGTLPAQYPRTRA
jgi:hypothetical protein